MRQTAFVLFLSLAACKAHKPAATSGGDPMASMTQFKDRMCACKDAVCARAVSAEMAAAPSSQPTALTAEQQKQANDLGSQIGECMLRASAPPTVGEAAGSAAAPIAGVPPSCADYKAAVDKLATCEAIAKAAREQLQDGYATAAKSWAATPEAARASLDEACKAGRESVVAAGKAQCGW